MKSGPFELTQSILCRKHVGNFLHMYSRAGVALATPMRRQHMGQRQVLTYDVTCKYKINVVDRIKAGELVDDDEIPAKLDLKVPVWHQGGHVPSCMGKNSFRTTRNVGRTHGESVESIWEETNPYGFATREMGLGHRIENLSGLYNERNYRKIVNECKSVLGCSRCRRELIVRVAAERLFRQYLGLCVEVERKKTKLTNIESTLTDDTLEKCRADAAKRGGEKYRPRERRGKAT